jgi:hypothetical protein
MPQSSRRLECSLMTWKLQCPAAPRFGLFLTSRREAWTCVYVYMCMCVCVCVYVYVCMCMCSCVGKFPLPTLFPSSCCFLCLSRDVHSPFAVSLHVAAAAAARVLRPFILYPPVSSFLPVPRCPSGNVTLAEGNQKVLNINGACGRGSSLRCVLCVQVEAGSGLF